MKDVVKENVSIDANRYIDSFKKFNFNLMKSNINLSENIIIGVLLHIACAIENFILSKKLIISTHNERIFKFHTHEMNIIESSVKPIEKEFNIIFTKEEYSNIAKIVYLL